MTHATTTTKLDADNPWPGLESYGEDAHDFFFGRVHECEKLLKKVLDAPVTVLFGRSGFGKTSLLHAGLFPLLRNEKCLPIYVRFDLKPGAPNLTRQLHEFVRNCIQAEAPDAMLLMDDESLWDYLHRADLELWSARNYLLTPVIVLDQFEELFTLGEGVPDQVAAFRYDLADLAENRIPADLAARIKNDAAEARRFNLRSHNYRLLISLREDYLPHLEEWCRFIPALGRSRMRLLPLGTGEAFDAVYKPAEHMMTSALAHRVVGIIAGAGLHPGRETALSNGDSSADRHGAADVEPTLLSLVCRELNVERKRLGRAQFDEQLIEEHGRSTIPNYYTSCVDGMRLDVAKFIENQLITKTGFRNFEAVEDAVPSRLTQDELDKLIDLRLVRLAEYHGTQRIELIHDVLTGTVRDHRDRRLAEEEKAALEATAERERQAFALREAQLDRERRVERDRRLESERVGRRLKWLSAALAIVCVVVVGLAAVTYYVSKKAEKALRDGVAERLSASGQLMLLTADSGREMDAFGQILGAQKLSGKPGIGPLLTALISKPELEKVIDLPGEDSLFSPDGRRVFTESEAGIQMLDAATGDPVGKTFGDAMSNLRAVSWDGHYAVVVGSETDGASDIRVWDTDSGTPAGRTITVSKLLPPVAVSMDGKRVAGATADIAGDRLGVAVRLWDTPSGEEIFSGKPDDLWLRDLEFDPTGRTLAIGTWNGGITLWDGRTGDLVRDIALPDLATGNRETSVNSVAFSPDGQVIAAGGREGRRVAVQVWNAATGELRSYVRSFDESGNAGDISVGFNADGSRVVAGSTDGNVRIVDVAAQSQIGGTIGLIEPVTQVAFHDNEIVTISEQSLSILDSTPEGTLASELPGSQSPYLDGADAFALYITDAGPRIATIRGKTLRWLGPDTGEQMGRDVASDALADVSLIEDGSALDLSHDEQWLALAGPDAKIRIINVSTGEVSALPTGGHAGTVQQVVFSPDGDRLASVADDGMVRLWDRRKGEEIASANTGDTPNAVEFSEDGERLYTRSFDAVRIWDNQLRSVGDPITGGLIWAWAFEDGGDNLAVVDVSNGVYIIQQYDAHSGQKREGPLTGYTKNIVAIDYIPDSRYLVSLGRDASVRFWDEDSGEQVGMKVPIQVGDARYVASYVASSDDGRRVFVTAISAEDADGRRGGGIWEVPGPTAWSDMVCAKLASNPTDEQWDGWVPEGVGDEEVCPGK